jgi:hypothetical protein
MWAQTCPTPPPQHVEASTFSLVAPYAPVLVVLAVTGVDLLRGQTMESVSWFIALALVLLVLGREALRAWDGFRQKRDRGQDAIESPYFSGRDSIPAWQER